MPIAPERLPPGDLIRDLADVGPADRGLVGGKAFHLGALLRRGFMVPRWFCVTSHASRHIDHSGDGSARLSAPLRHALVTAWRQSGFALAAVRSSASTEDSVEESWTGIFPTTLAVSGEDGLLVAVSQCFAALQAAHLALYRKTRHICARPVMSVLIQDFFPARAAGIIYTTHPLTGGGDDIVVNVVHGLGDPLAAGRISGDLLVLDRRGALKQLRRALQPFMATATGDVPVPETLQIRSAISTVEAAALARVANDVELLFRRPQDIEFAIDERGIHVLQARPITRAPGKTPVSDEEIEAYIEKERSALAARIAILRSRRHLSARPAVFSNGNIGEFLPLPTPMSFGLFCRIFSEPRGAIVSGRRALGYRLDDDATKGLYTLICGQPYFNVERNAGTFDIGVPIDLDKIFADIERDPGRANYPEFGLYQQGIPLEEARRRYGRAEGRRRHDRVRRFHAAMIGAAGEFRGRFLGEIETNLQHRMTKALEFRPSTMNDADLLAAFAERLRFLRENSCRWFVIAARLAFFFADRVRARVAHHLGDDGTTTALLQGLAGSRITQQALDLERLAKGRLPRSTFLARYGHMSANELELLWPRLAEEPAAIDRLVADLSASGRHLKDEFHEQRRRRLGAERDLRRRLREAGIPPTDIAALFGDLGLAQAFLPLRETIKYYFAADYAALRAILVALNQRLAWARDDIFYLAPEEIADCFRASRALAAQVAERRRERDIAGVLARQRRHPAVVFERDLAALGAARGGVATSRLAAIPVAAGTVEGVVRVIDENAGMPSFAGLGCGEIIVTRSANLGLAPLLRMAGGLVVEVGGILAHAACQARESGIPAVVLADATSRLKDGMTISLDGDRGVVEIVDVS